MQIKTAALSHLSHRPIGRAQNMNLYLLQRIYRKIIIIYHAIYSVVNKIRSSKRILQYTIGRLTQIYEFIFICKNYFLDYNLSINLLIPYTEFLERLNKEVETGESKEMMLRERLISDIEKIKADLEKCFNTNQEDLYCLELQDFYEKLSNRKMQSLEETNSVIFEFHKKLKTLLIKIDRLSEKDKYGIQSIFLLTDIINYQSELIDDYWDYIHPSARFIFTDLHDLYNAVKTGCKSQNKRETRNSVDTILLVKLYIQLKLHRIFNSQDPLAELNKSLGKYVKSLKKAREQDEENLDDYKCALEMKKKIENEGTIDWSEL